MNHRWLFFSVLVFAVFAVGQVLPPPTIEITAEPNHHLMLENQFVRVFKVELAPHAAMIVHNHRHDYFFTVLGESHIENDVVGKPPALRTFRDGETFFVLGDFAHTAKNLSDQTFRVVAVELMGNDKGKPSPKWGRRTRPAHPERRHPRHSLRQGRRTRLRPRTATRRSRP